MRPAVGAEVTHEEGAHSIPSRVLVPRRALAQLMAPVNRRQVRRELSEYRLHPHGIDTAAWCGSGVVVTVRGACHLRYRCATAAKAALGSHSMSG